MTHPMIDADDPLVADLLGGTIELVREAGGFVAPITRLVERGGQLSIESSAAAGEPLLRIPREAFVRVDRVEWSQDGDRIVIEQAPDDCGALEWEMLYLQVALHNACGKLAWMQRTHPSLPSSKEESSASTFSPGTTWITVTPGSVGIPQPASTTAPQKKSAGNGPRPWTQHSNRTPNDSCPSHPPRRNCPPRRGSTNPKRRTPRIPETHPRTVSAGLTTSATAPRVTPLLTAPSR